MTYTADRRAAESLGRSAAALEAAATAQSLIVSKRWIDGLWTVEVVSIQASLRLRASAATEAAATDDILDQLNRHG